MIIMWFNNLQSNSDLTNSMGPTKYIRYNREGFFKLFFYKNSIVT
jgi:hypothetical protein